MFHIKQYLCAESSVIAVSVIAKMVYYYLYGVKGKGVRHRQPHVPLHLFLDEGGTPPEYALGQVMGFLY